MFISNEENQVSLPLESSFMESNSGSLDGLPRSPELSDSSPVVNGYTDVNVVPEHEKHELEQVIVNLEGLN